MPLAALYRRYALGTLAYNLAVIAWGAYVRATGSGAGCGEHWPKCDGAWIPRAATTARLIEYTHRVSSGLALLSVLGLLALAYRAFPSGHPARRASAAAVGLMLAEALLGAGLVLLGLTDKDASAGRAVAMSLHLVNTFALLASLGRSVQAGFGFGPLELRLRLKEQGGPSAVLYAALLALPLLGVTGAIAALGDTLFPAHSLAEGLAADASPTAHFLLRLRAVHPFLALGAGLLVALAAAWAAQARPSPRVRDAAYALAALFLLQLGAGVLNLALLAPVWMQLVHLLLADGVWLALVWLAGAALEAGAPGAQPAPEAAAA